jgi:tRNA nucleotidyltransferase/poly(A) polymerase
MRLGFDIDEPLKQAIIHNIDMLAYITPAKVNAEINKMLHIDEEQTKHLLNSFGIQEAY